MSSFKGLTFNEVTTLGAALPGAISLKVYNQLVLLTRHGQVEAKICARTMADKLSCSVRAVWDALRILEEKEMLSRRRRFAWVRGVWKKISNAYRLTRPRSRVQKAVAAVVSRFKMQLQSNAAICAVAFPSYGKPRDSFTRSTSSAQSVERFVERTKARNTSLTTGWENKGPILEREQPYERHYGHDLPRNSSLARDIAAECPQICPEEALDANPGQRRASAHPGAKRRPGGSYGDF